MRPHSILLDNVLNKGKRHEMIKKLYREQKVEISVSVCVCGGGGAGNCNPQALFNTIYVFIVLILYSRWKKNQDRNVLHIVELPLVTFRWSMNEFSLVYQSQ